MGQLKIEFSEQIDTPVAQSSVLWRRCTGSGRQDRRREEECNWMQSSHLMALMEELVIWNKLNEPPVGGSSILVKLKQ